MCVLSIFDDLVCKKVILIRHNVRLDKYVEEVEVPVRIIECRLCLPRELINGRFTPPPSVGYFRRLQGGRGTPSLQL
jgi:hypothetical protein